MFEKMISETLLLCFSLVITYTSFDFNLVQKFDSCDKTRPLSSRFIFLEAYNYSFDLCRVLYFKVLKTQIYYP